MDKISLTAFIFCLIITAITAQEDKPKHAVSKEWMHSQTGVPSHAFQTKTGLLLWNNFAYGGYTIQVGDVVSSAKPPFFEFKNGNLIISKWRFDKLLIGKDDNPEKVLLKFMLEECQYILKNASYGLKLTRTERFIPIEIDSMQQAIDSLNFWHYDNYKYKGEKPDEIKAIFYMDGYFDNILIRFVYYSKSGSEDEAEKDLLRIFKNIRFYSHKINIIRLD